MFETKVGEEIPGDYIWHDERPGEGDELLSIDGREISPGIYADYIQALRGLRRQIDKPVEVRWRDQHTQETHSAQAVVRNPPAWTYFWSGIWFMQEFLIFGIGARVFWKRPKDDSARLFFVLCIVTVGAFMGGYHWTEIVVEPLLIYLFRDVRRLRAGGEPAFLPGVSPCQSVLLAASPGSLAMALRGLNGVSGRVDAGDA